MNFEEISISKTNIGGGPQTPGVVLKTLGTITILIIVCICDKVCCLLNFAHDRGTRVKH